MTLEVDEWPLTSIQADRNVMRMARFVGLIRGRGMGSRLRRFLRPASRAPVVLQPKEKDRRIRVVYRHVAYSGDALRFPAKHRPRGFEYSECLRNLLETIESSRFSTNVSLHVYYNGTAEQFASDPTFKLLSDYRGEGRVRFVEADSALEAYLIMLRGVRASHFQGDDILYLLENDYLHHRSWVDEVVAVFNGGIPFDYVSLYDHPDRYRIAGRYDSSKLFATSSWHWITAPSTCASFLLTYGTFVRDFGHFYSHKVDHRMFSDLTQSRKRRVLLTPVPGLATHCMEAHLDPVRRFERYFGDRECHDL